jgi:hypothetical protein
MITITPHNVKESKNIMIGLSSFASEQHKLKKLTEGQI